MDSVDFLPVDVEDGESVRVGSARIRVKKISMKGI